MSTPLAKQIEARLKAKDLSVTMLERAAGLKTHAVQNILRGKSKKPSAELLQSIADVLGCTIKELLSSPDIFHEEELVKTKREVLEAPYQQPEILEKIVKMVNKKVLERRGDLTNQQVFTYIQEVYLHSLQKEPPHIDQEFVDWYIDLIPGVFA